MTTFRVLDRNDRDLRLGHRSLNFDRSGVAIDLNVVYPIDRIQELATDGTIGEVAPHHLAFTGAQADTLSQVQMDSGPVAARQLIEEGVEVVLFAAVCPLCTRTICTLAHVFEAAGLATVALVSMRSVAERMRPPLCAVLRVSAGATTRQTKRPEVPARCPPPSLISPRLESGPVLQDHPEVIVADETQLACPLPPRYDPQLPPAVDEAQGLRAAYDRSRLARGRTSVGRVVDPKGVPDALRVLGSIASGTPWDEAGIPGGDTVAVVLDVRSYYLEEAALELIESTAPGSRQTERWFYEFTLAGRTVRSPGGHAGGGRSH